MKMALCAAAAILAVAGTANAAIIPTLESVTPDGSDYLWSYQGTLAGDEGVSASNGSRLVIFDFAGYVPGSIFAPTPDIATSIEYTSTGVQTPPGFVDNPLLPNLVFTWIGPDFDTTGGPYSDINFDGLGAESTFNLTTISAFGAKSVKNNGPEVGTTDYNDGHVAVPTAAVPEPATWAMMLFGIGMLGAVARRRRLGAVAA